MEKSDKVRILSHFSPSHEPLVILYLVPHFSEVWKCGKVRQSEDIVALSPNHEPLVILYLVPHFSEVLILRKQPTVLQSSIAFALQMVRPSRRSDDEVKWRFRLQ